MYNIYLLFAMFDCFLVDFIVVIVVCLFCCCFFYLFIFIFCCFCCFDSVVVAIIIVDIVLRAGRRFIDDMGIFFSHRPLKISRNYYFLVRNKIFKIYFYKSREFFLYLFKQEKWNKWRIKNIKVEQLARKQS